ncbi:MAG TPA: hypothetical protein V6D08_19350 [Candidatus Obscuribacterales bacterium]
MPKMTKERLAKRKAAMAARARAEVAKTEIVQFRLDADNISRLYEFATALRKPVGTLVREWVLERMASEQGGSKSQPVTQQEFSKLADRVAEIEKKMA